MRTQSNHGSATRRLREGFTTGTCATAAAAAAVKMLYTGELIDAIEVELPAGNMVLLELTEHHVSENEASCGVVKDAGDDPDVTHGMVICARARRASGGIFVGAGEGIGIVTKPGLSVPVGQPAINPIPRMMIENNVKRILKGLKSVTDDNEAKYADENENGVEVLIYAPEGIARAKKTLNERLGIIGGISILGTTGIVRPMSLPSLKASLLPQVDIAMALGYSTVALVPGNMGAKVAENKLGFETDAIVHMSNFAGDLLECCAEKGVERVLILGHIGKIAKIAAGFFDTHSSRTESPVEILKNLVRTHVEDDKPMALLENANTADEVAVALSKTEYAYLLEKIVEQTSSRAREHVKNQVEIGTAITILSGDIVAIDEKARQIIGDKT